MIPYLRTCPITTTEKEDLCRFYLPWNAIGSLGRPKPAYLCSALFVETGSHPAAYSRVCSRRVLSWSVLTLIPKGKAPVTRASASPHVAHRARRVWSASSAIF